jgi:hypothetical protein
MNGTCFSSTSALIANIKNTTKAVFIGEESGGLMRGRQEDKQFPSFCQIVTSWSEYLPILILDTCIKNIQLAGAFSLTIQIEDLLANRDLEMEKAKELIMRSR